MDYEPLPSMPEDGGERGGTAGSPDEALLGEGWQWAAVPNLDQFFTRTYRYWEEKGFVVMLTARLLNLAALAFTVAMSALLLLYVNWGALQDPCLKADTCDLWKVAIRAHPLAGRWSFYTLLSVSYLSLFSLYWLAALAHLLYESRDLAEVRRFCNDTLGISDRQMATITWPEVAHRLVQVQRTHRLCAARDLSEHDIVSRVMRKENYLIGMLNKGVLALNVPVPGLRRYFLLTKTLEWNLYWCLLDAMFDERSFRLKPAFLHNEAALRRRLRVMALCNLAVAPFLLAFLLIYFFMKNAEKFYHHPSSVGARRWSPLAQWRLREFNELPHFVRHRLAASHTAAEDYIQQFPSLILSHVARLVSFVAGSVAALLLCITFIDERLLERDLLGRQLVWWVAVVGVLLALSRAFVIESTAAFDPETALMEVVAHTHYLPRHWRGRAHTREVQGQFQALFQYKALLFWEELSSILLTPLLLWFSLPQCAGAVLAFVEEHTVHVEGVGDVCSLAAFDFQRHGNARYGAPAAAPKLLRSRQGKMEKSFLSFAATYTGWEPDAAGQALLQQLAGAPAAPALAASLHTLHPMLPLGAARSPAAAAALRRRGAAAAAGNGYGGRHAGLHAVGGGDGLFGSAELAAGDQLVAEATSNLAAPPGTDPLDPVTASQLLLQSLYEQRRGQPAQQQRRQQPGQQAAQEQQKVAQQQQQQHAAGSPGLGAGMQGGQAAHPVQPQHPQQQQQQQQQQQHVWQQVQQPVPILQPAAARPAASPLHLPHASASPQQRVLGAQLPAGSPRQPWLGRSPSARQRISEQQLSVLSRENSSAEYPPGGSSGGGGALVAAALDGGSLHASPAAPLPRLSGHGSPSPPDSMHSMSESLLQQQLLLLGQHGSQLASSSGPPASGSRSRSTDDADDGPPEFF